MSDIFSPIVMKLISLGFMNFLIFLLVLAVMYAILKKTKILGGSPVIDGIVSFVVAFMVFAYPILTGISLAIPLTTFFTQAFVFVLLFVVAFLIASLFYPNLLQWLPTVFTSRNALWGMIGLALAIFVTSGVVSVMYTSTASQTTPSVPRDVSIVAAGLVILIVVLIISSSMRG